jgi:hypothetical protein
MRFFANTQNNTIGSFFVIQQRSEGSHVLICFERKETITGDSQLKEENVNFTPLGDGRSKKNKLQEGRK